MSGEDRETYPRGEREWKPGDESTPMLLRAADRLYEECRQAIMAHRLDARSRIGDAVLDYREERDEAAARSAGAPFRDDDSIAESVGRIGEKPVCLIWRILP